MSEYGFGGNMDALDWLHMMGNKGIPSLQADDRDQLKEAGVLDEANLIRSEQLNLAIEYRNTGHVICDAVGKSDQQKNEVLATPMCHPYEKDFGLGPHHPFNQ